MSAIDPGDLEEGVLAMSNVNHLKCQAQEVIGKLPGGTLLVCDVNCDPRDAAKDMLVPLAGE